MSRGRPSLTERLARASARRAVVAVVAWAAVFAAALGVYVSFGGSLSASDDFLGTPESKRVERLVHDKLPGTDAETAVVVVTSDRHRLGDDDGVFLRRLADITTRLEGIDDRYVTSVVSVANLPAEVAAALGVPGGERSAAGEGGAAASTGAAAEGAAGEAPEGALGQLAEAAKQMAASAAAQQAGDAVPQLVSDDGRAALVLVTLAGSASQGERYIDPVYDAVIDEDGRGGFAVAVTGSAAWEREAHALSERDLLRAEAIGVPIALVILVFVFGAVAAAVLPLVLAAVAIALALALTALLGTAADISVFAVNIITMMGLAVGIDYSLLIVSRFREERAAGLDVRGAVERAGATAGRAVLFSGGIVVFALCGMLVVPFSIFTSLGAGAIFVVVAAVVVALTLLPALLRLIGGGVDRLRVPLPGRRHAGRATAPGAGFWAGAARVIMRRPIISLALGGGLLVALAIPLFSMERGMPGAEQMPEHTSTRRGFTVLQRDFSAGLNAPILVAVSGDLADPHVGAATERLERAVALDDRYQIVGRRKAVSGDLAVLELAVNADATSAESMDAVRDLRAEFVPEAEGDAPAEVLVGGVPGLYTDAIDLIDAYTPVVIAVVLTLSFVLLLFAFRSLVIAVKAILMNLLSVGAALGIITAVFQNGVGAELLGFQQVESIAAWLPLMMFCVLFGLSMDYHVFLLSRVRERYDRSGDTTDAVAFGVSSTAGIITGAALIMVAVFGGVAAGDLTMFQQLGFGLAVAVALDASVVRIVVVPSTMALLGRWNWYLPRWLEWLPRVSVEDTSSVRPVKVETHLE